MAEIGRISGPLLKENLLRDTVNLRVESNLLYFDVNTHAADVALTANDPVTYPLSTWTGRIGIHTSNPAYELDVVGTTRTNALLVKTNGKYENAYADIDNIRLDGNKIQSQNGFDLELAGSTLTNKVKILTNTLIDADLEVSGDVAVNGGDLTTNQTSFNLINGTATTVQAFGAAELLVFASSTGTTTFRSDVVINKDLQIKGGDLTTNTSTFNLFNADASTINAFGAASTINIGAPLSGTTTVRNDLQVNGSVSVNGDVNIGGNLTLGDTTFDSITVVADFTSNLIPNTTDTYDLGTPDQAWRNLYATNIEITGNLGLSQIAIDGNKISTTESNADLEFDTAGTGRYVFIGTGGVILPVGNTAERPTPPAIGMIRFNTDDQRVENYNGEEWNRMVHDDDAIAFAIALG